MSIKRSSWIASEEDDIRGLCPPDMALRCTFNHRASDGQDFKDGPMVPPSLFLDDACIPKNR